VEFGDGIAWGLVKVALEPVAFPSPPFVKAFNQTSETAPRAPLKAWVRGVSPRCVG
jgi:hypothetical protein